MTNPKLALIPSGYKGGTNPTVYSILPSDGGGDFDFDRANGYASRVRKDGLIEEVSNDVPRLDWYNSNCPSLLLEQSRTNLITYSEDFSQSIWTKTNLSILSNSIISPEGILSADKLIPDTTSGQHKIDITRTVTNGATVSLSAFVKKGEYNFCCLYEVTSSKGRFFDLSNGTQGGTFVGTPTTSNIENYNNDWYRISISTTVPSTSARYILYVCDTISNTSFVGDNIKGIYTWGAQLETGSYATSYIKSNSGSITTRFKDECINAGDSDLFDITEGTFFVDANNFGTPYLDFSMITLSDGSSNFVRFIYETSRIRTSVENGSIQQDYFITGVNDNERNKVAITFKENEFKTYLNGVLKDTDLIGVVPTNLDRLNFASQSGTSRNFEGKVYDTRVYDRVLTEAEAIELTTL